MTTESKLLVDTDILSLYLRKQPKVVTEGQNYLNLHGIFTFSIITRFEILRGMKARNAKEQLKFFDLFCSSNEVINLDDEIIIRASDIMLNYAKRVR